ncbi:MAG: flagellar motor protein MotB, partial [Bacteroidetes bacterium]
TENSEGAHTISADGHLLIFTACNRKSGFGSCDLFYSEYDCGEWSPVQVIPPPVSTGAWESQPSLSADGKKLYFASNRPGGIGEKDLWVAERQADGSWGTPQNLGAGINTPKDEKAPFIHPDGQTLYFLSSGHPGLGFEDLFICRKQSDGSWGTPQNFGYPINTENSEGPIFVSLDGKQAYFSSNRTDFEEAYGKMDIYTFELPPHLRPQPVTYVKATVRDEKDNRPLIAQVEFVDLMTGESYVQNQTDCDGVFLVTLPSGKNYMLNINRDGYFFYSDHFELSAGGSFDDPFLLDVRLRPIPSQNASTDLADAAPGAPIILKNVFFETGSAELKPESLIELNRLKALLEAHPELKIQINGHTDHVGTEEDNLKLSNDRAKAVYDYLVQNGIHPERLRYKGFGESRPIDTNDTEAGRRNNRRTEFEVIATE